MPPIETTRRPTLAGTPNTSRHMLYFRGTKDPTLGRYSVPTPTERAALQIAGRERERHTVRECLATALAGCGSLVLIGGEAGIGKTTLAEMLCKEATNQGANVLVGRCYDLTETPPYGPWIELFARYRPTDAMPPLPPAFAERGTVGSVTSERALFHQVEE